MSNTLSKRVPLRTENSTESIGRPTKFFKLDRTYSDVVEDELYDPMPEQTTTTPPSQKATSDRPKTQRIQSAYPQLFNGTAANDEKDDDLKYWPGMESSIRFDRAIPGSRDQIIADKKQKLREQPEQNTVSPKEAFLDYQENANEFPTTGSVFQLSNARQSSEVSESSHRTSSSQQSKRPSLFPTLSSLEGFDNNAPKTITPVRQREQLSPRPVTQRPTDPLQGPSPSQAKDNTNANARIRAMYKEESSTSITSNDRESTITPRSAGNDSDYQPNSPPHYVCEECHASFDKLMNFNSHRKQHAVPAPVYQRQHPNEEVEDDYSPSGSGRKSNPHRCDWVIPSTGKVCGVVFSRPYDLVRHQDTIHRAKKLEFKCEDCIANGIDKVFSRNDALVRHMRHVHKKEWKK